MQGYHSCTNHLFNTYYDNVISLLEYWFMNERILIYPTWFRVIVEFDKETQENSLLTKFLKMISKDTPLFQRNTPKFAVKFVYIMCK